MKKKLILVFISLLFTGRGKVFAQSSAEEQKAMDILKDIGDWSIEIMYESATKEVKTLADGGQETTVKTHGYNDLELIILNDLIYNLNNNHGYDFKQTYQPDYGRIQFIVFVTYYGSERFRARYHFRIYLRDKEGNIFLSIKGEEGLEYLDINRITTNMITRIDRLFKESHSK